MAEIPQELMDEARSVAALISPFGDEREEVATIIARALYAERKRAADIARSEVSSIAENFWAFLQGEYGVKLASADYDDHNVSKFFAALEAIDATAILTQEKPHAG